MGLGKHWGEELHDEFMEETARETQEGMDEDISLEEMVKISKDAGLIPKYAVLFIDPDDYVVHAVFYEQRPSVSSISANIEEMKYDKDFGIGEQEALELTIDIINIEDGGDV